MTAPKIIDWERVEAEYRIGIKTLREIAEPFNITEAAIRKRAKRDKWARDLTERIRLKSEDKVRKSSMVREPCSTLTPDNEDDIVEFVATNNAFLITEQGSRTADGLSLVDSLMEELKQETINKNDYEKLADIMASPDDKGQDKLNDAYRRAISLPLRIDGIKKLSETAKTLTELQRKIHNIDEQASTHETYEDYLMRIRGG